MYTYQGSCYVFFVEDLDPSPCEFSRVPDKFWGPSIEINSSIIFVFVQWVGGGGEDTGV